MMDKEKLKNSLGQKKIWLTVLLVVILLFAGGFLALNTEFTDIFVGGEVERFGEDITNEELRFFEAAQEGDLEALEGFVEEIDDIDIKNNYDRTPMMLAANNGHTEATRLLLEEGANIENRNIFQETALMMAAHEGHVETVELLIEYGADVNAERDDGTHVLDYTEYEEIENILRQHGASR